MAKPLPSAAAALCCGIFLCTRPEIDWFLNGIKWFFPQEHARFVAPIAEPEQGDLLHAYCRRLFSDNPAENLLAARTWSRYEGSCLHLLPHPEVADEFGAASPASRVPWWPRPSNSSG